MSALILLRRLWQHGSWADDIVERALDPTRAGHAEAWREYAHILGAQEVWLSRLEHRERRLDVWPTLGGEAAGSMRRALADAYAALLANATDSDLERVVEYNTTDGRAFASTTGDILMQVVLHGQYHRGKVNLLLRQATDAAAPVDFIAFSRGAPAATTR